MLITLVSCWNKEGLDVFEVKIKENEKASSCWESNPGQLACAASALPLRYDNQTTGQLPALTILNIQNNSFKQVQFAYLVVISYLDKLVQPSYPLSMQISPLALPRAYLPL